MLKKLLKKALKHLDPRKLTPRQILKLVRLGAVLVMAFIVFLVGAYFAYGSNLPDPSRINSRDVVESTKILDRHGELLYEIHGEVKRTLVEFDEIPQHVKDATIALEDKDFYSHRGIDFTGIARAAFKDVFMGKRVGGSSITQQLVKNALLTREKTFTRKFKELVLTIKIEQNFSKDDILKMYLNEIPYGQNAYGIEAAAQTYFNKSARDLTLAETGYLVALPQRPSYFNPFGSHREQLDGRKNYALQRMADLGFISAEEAKTAQSEEVKFNAERTGLKAPHFVIYIQELLEERFGRETLEQGGYKVTTTLDYEIQQMAEEAVAERAAFLSNYGATNAGLVAVDPKTGEILAMVGSIDFFNEENQGQVNIAVRERQPGSSFKPYVYAAAFEQGLAPATMLVDVNTVFGTVGGRPYEPHNNDGSQHGPISIRRALAGSLNIPAVKTLALVGVRNAINTAKDLGISSPLSADNCGLSLVLGGCEVKLLDHTAAMGVFANGGRKYETKAVLKIEDNRDEIIFEIKEDKGRQALSQETAYLIADVMSDNAARSFIFGSGSFLTLPGREVAAKTGTTQNFRDAWTMGYTPQISAGVWVGNMDGTLMKSGAYGSTVAAPIWNSFMRKAHAGRPVENFSRPGTIVEVEVDALSGLLPTTTSRASGSTTVIEKFAPNSIPTESDNIHQLVLINRENGRLATTSTPAELVETRLYKVLHSEKPNDSDWENAVRNWALRNGYQYPPTEKDGNGEVSKPDENETVSFQEPLYIVSPQNNQIINGTTSIKIEAAKNMNLTAADISVYLRDDQGESTKLSGEVAVNSTSSSFVYTLTFRPNSAFKSGRYNLFATTNDGLKSNYVEVEVK